MSSKKRSSYRATDSKPQKEVSKISESTEHDRAFFERELASFVPDNVFDAHCHLSGPNCDDGIGDASAWPVTGYEEYRYLIDMLHPGRRVAAHFLTGSFIAWGSTDEQVRLSNEWVSKQIAKAPDCRGCFFIRPTDDPEWVRQEVRRLGLHGLKCYHTYSAVTPTWDADIPDYLPESLVKIAHDEGLTITLHMVKSRAVADPSNIYWIRRYCEKYPNMKLILAHSARGFQPSHNLEGLVQLKGLDNLYFDTSANCEPIAHQAIIRIIGHKKLMYGSDLPVSHMRGRSVSAADSFLWLYGETPVWGAKHLKIDPVLVGLEHLRSIKWACWSEKLSDSEVEDIFWNNAAQLFNVK